MRRLCTGMLAARGFFLTRGVALVHVNHANATATPVTSSVYVNKLHPSRQSLVSLEVVGNLLGCRLARPAIAGDG